MTEEIFVAVIFLIYAAVAIIKPDWLAAFQKWSNQKLLGAKFEASARTLMVYRAMGVLFLVLAGLLVTGLIE